MDEWELLSQMRPGNNIKVNDLEMLGHREFDKNHNWSHNNICTELHETVTSFIEVNHLSIQLHEDIPYFSNYPHSLSPTQCIAFDLVMSHFRNTTYAQPLKLVIQGTVGTGKSYLISCLKFTLQTTSEQNSCPLLLLAPMGVADFNIHASTIHFALRIPIGEMHPLEGQSLSKLQEELRHIRYILIDEMSFIGPKMLNQIDARLRQAFPLQCTIPFGG